MKKSNRLDIVFGIDNNYVGPLLVSAYSVMKNNTTFNEVFFHIITSGISPINQQKIRKMETVFSGVHVDFSIVDEEMFMEFPLHIKHISAIAYGRFLIPDIFTNLDKVLYLDSDILVLDDLYKLWETNIDSACVAGSHKSYITTQFPGYKESIGLNAESTYINSGVMLMNLTRMRKLNMTHKLLHNAKSLKDIVKIQDQDIINITFRDEIATFHKKYNYTDSDRREGSFKENDVVIAHFNTGNKPWNSDFVKDETNKVFYEKYLEYQREIITQ